MQNAVGYLGGVLQARHRIYRRLATCSDTGCVGDPWTSQIALGVFATELTNAVCRKIKRVKFSDKPGLHTTFHGGCGSSNSLGLCMWSGKGVWPPVCSSHIVLQDVLCQAEGPSQGELCNCCRLQALLQRSHCSYHVT